MLDNFLGTFTSRYSAYRGYWLFGFLVTGAASLDLDLLTVPTSSDAGPVNAAADLAARKFHEQLAKHGLESSRVRIARVVVETLPEEIEGVVNGRSCLYNWCRKHMTIGTSPAVAAGIADHVWSIEEMVGLLEAQEQAAIDSGALKRGPHGKRERSAT